MQERCEVLIYSICHPFIYLIEALVAEARRTERVDLAIDPQNANAMRLLEEFSRRSRTAALPAGWVELVDPASGCAYYAHTATATSQWERPV
jgi:hypothetical protein